MGIRAAMCRVLGARSGPDGARGMGVGDPADAPRPRRAASRALALDGRAARHRGARHPGERGSARIFLLVLATAGYAVHTESRSVLQSRVVENTLSDGADEIRLPGPRPGRRAPRDDAPGGLVLARAVDHDRVVAPRRGGRRPDQQLGAGAGAMSLASLDVRRATDLAVPTASMLGQTVSIKGNGAEHVGGVEGAVDRIATEILRRLEQGRTLVIWAFDASGSLQVERERLSKHIDTVYTHITQLDEKGLAPTTACSPPSSPSARPQGR